MDETNPLDALDEQPQGESNPLDAMDEPSLPASEGLREPGTIKDLWNRPPLRNPDGSVSTTLSFSIGTDKGETLIPQVVEGKKLSREEAIERFRRTGEHLGVFDSPDHADTYAQALHDAQSKYLLHGSPPRWNGDQLVGADGRVIYDGRAPAVLNTAYTMDSALSQVPDETIPQVTEAEGGYTPKQIESWRETLGAVSPTIGARIESKLAGAQEYSAKSAYGSARTAYWRSMVLPRAAAEAKDAGINLIEHPDVVDNAKRLGVSPDFFASRADDFQGMSEQELSDFQARQREKMADAQVKAATGAGRRRLAAQVSAGVRPDMPEWSPQSIAFDAMTSVPDLLIGVGGTVAGGPALGLAAMMTSIAPEEWSAAKNQGLDDKRAATYATLSTLAQGAPELPVLRIVSGGAAGRSVVRKLVGETLAESAPGKVAGTALTQGVSQAIIQGLQESLDAGFIDRDTSLKEALSRIGRAGIMGTAMGAPIGALHAGMSRAPRAPREAPAARREPTIGTLPDIPPRVEPQIAPVERPAAAASPAAEPPAPGEGQPSAAPSAPAEAVDTHAALQALQDKTISPPQMEHLEGLGLARRNDLGVPFMLPAGRRAMVELQKEPEAEKQTPEPAQELPKGELTARLASDQGLRAGLEQMKTETGWAQKGGNLMRDATTGEVSGRTTWIPNAEWWKERPKGLKEAEVHAAVDKALAGQKLSVPEQRIVQFMAGVHDERAQMEGVHAQIEAAVPAAERQAAGPDADSLLHLTTRAAEHDQQATTAVLDTWDDDHPATLARVHEALQDIIARGQQAQAEGPRHAEARPGVPAQAPARGDLFGQDTRTAQALADEQRRRDLARSPDRDVSLETGRPDDLFSQARQQVDFTDQLGESRLEPVSHGVLADAKVFGNTEDAHALRSKGFDSLNRDRQQQVVEHVRRAIDDPQVLRSVIQSVPIDVMHMLVGPERSAKDILHDPSMLTHRLAIAGDVPVPQAVARFVHSLATKIGGVPTKDGAKEARLPGTPASIDERRAAARTSTAQGSVGHQKEFTAQLQAARDATNTAPTEAQKIAGTYKKGELPFAGMTLAIENPKGSTRTGVKRTGERWSRQMAHDYGYVKRTEGADGDPVDVFLTGKPDTGKVFVVNQVDPATGKFDEVKAVLGAASPEEAQAVYRANYPKGWKGLGSIVEMPTERFRHWAGSEDASKPAPTGERRIDVAHRKAVAAMTPEELRKDLLTHELTGIPNRRAYQEAARLPVQVSIDANSLKFINDAGGHEAGDHVLKAIATALHEETEHAYHLGGDEFVVQARSHEEAERVLASAKDRLARATVELAAADGRRMTVKGIGIAHGAGETLEAADRNLQREKARQEAAGLRAPRGEQPPGTTLAAAQSRLPSEESHAAPAVARTRRASSTTPVLQDVGEKIGGARKDLFAERGMELKDLDTMSDAEAATLVTKKNVWAPDYAAQIKAGQEPLAAALSKVLYDKLAASPRKNTPEGRRQYVQAMRAVREHLGGAKTVAEVRQAEDKIANAVGFGVQARSRGSSPQASDTFFSIIRGRRSTLRVGYNEERAARQLIEKGFPNQEPYHARFEIKQGSGENLTEQGRAMVMEQAQKVGTPLSEERLKEGLYRVQQKNGKVVGYAHTKEGAEELARRLYSELKGPKGEGELPERPHLDKLERIGLPSTRERDVKSEDFLHDFGFRGIEFGNWAAGDERQKLVNLAYDGLHDMASTLHIPPQALSLNGTLGLAFGARGTGRAAAHYEPGKLVINMTKLSGAGSLAHEWAHAFDHYMGELDRPDAYKTEARGATGWYGRATVKTHEMLRPELKAAWKGVLQALFQRDRTQADMVRMRELDLENFKANLQRGKEHLARHEARPADQHDPQYVKRMAEYLSATERRIAAAEEGLAKAREEPEQPGTYGKVDSSYFEQARALSGKSGAKGYWARPTEMWARAFESFVFDKLGEAGAKSEYLVHGVEGDRYSPPTYKGNPYPKEERPAINTAIQNLVDALQTRPGKDGLPTLYARREGPGPGLERPAIERVVRAAVRDSGMRAAPDFPHVEVHEDYTTLPPDLRERVIRDGSQETAGAVYDPQTGAIHMIADNLGSPREAVETLWHEAVGHHGLRLIMNADRYAHTMDGIWNAMPERVRQTAERNGLDVNELAQRRMAAEEVIAYAAGQHLAGTAIDKPLRPFWQRALNAVRAFFARVTGKPFTDDRAIAGIIAESKRALESGSGLQRMGALAASQRAATFFSPVERAVTASKQGKASAEQWLAMIKKTPGVKPDEISWLGLEPWLKSHEGPVTREALADYVRANKLELEETHYGGEEPSEHEKAQTHHAEALRALGASVEINEDGSLDRVGFDHENRRGYSTAYFQSMTDEQIHEQLRGMSPEMRQHLEALREASEHVEREFAGDENFGRERGPKYEQLTLGGGENYHEMLLRLPERVFRPEDLPKRRGVFDRYRPQINSLQKQIAEATSRGTREHLQFLLNGLERERDAEADAVGPEQTSYNSQHWNEPNILAHVRTKDRVDAEGKKTLFLEELQSDLHQQGREKGYTTPEAVEARVRAGPEVRDLRPAAVEAVRRADYLGFDSEAEALAAIRSHADWKDRWPDMPAADQQLLDRYRDAAARLTKPREEVPDAPFKTSWPMLIMKRMIRHAAEGGYDRVSWTSGETQAERYNLQKHVKAIQVEKDATRPGDYRLVVWNHDNRIVVPNGGYGFLVGNAEVMRRYIGQELADKAMAEAERTGDKAHYTGLDLKIGGEGQKGFYDDILPRETNKLIKKYGAEVGTTTIKADNAPEEVVERVAAEDPEHPFVQKNRTPVHTFDVTPAMREAALSQGFPMFWKKPSQQTLGRKAGQGPGWYEAVRRAVMYLHSNPVTRDMRKLINPSKLSEEAKSTAVIARAALGNLAHQTFETQEALEKFSRQIDRLPPREQLEMMDAIEHGVPQPNADLQPVADALRKQLDTWREKVRGLGVGALDNFIENYFPHYWSKPDQAQRMIATIMGRRPLRGPASFLKMRTIPTIKEGMDAGLTPLTINPLVMTLLKVREMQRFVSGVKMMQSFKDAGLAQFLRSGKPMPEGWAEIKDNIARVRQWSEEEQGFIERGRYIMPEDGARLINNHLGRSHLADFALAQVVRVGANALNATQLGWSAFHLGFTTLDAAISKNALALERLAHGEVGRSLAAFAEGLTPAAPVMNLRRGFQLMKAYADPSGATPQMLRIVQALEVAGGRAQMDRYYMASHGVSPFRGAGVRSLAGDIRAALKGPQPVRQVGRAVATFPAEYAVSAYRELQGMTKTMPLLQVPFEIAGRFARMSTAWIMEHVVPLQKLGVFSDLAQDYLRRNPTATDDQLAKFSQSMWDSVDNRLGEMVYDNLFWNRTAKDTAHLAVRAVGWNLGTIREIGGAPIDALAAIDKLAREGKITADDLGHKIPYVLAMTMTTAMLGATINYLFTGEGPQELKDYFFPRTGGITARGTPQRVSLPSYVKDIYEYSQRPGRTIANKLNPIWSTTADIWENEDFYGNPISEPEAGGLTQFGERAGFAARQATPFAIQGSRQIAGSEKPGFVGGIKRVLPFVGVTPAPGYVTSPDQIARRERYEAEDKYSRDLKYKLNRAITSHADKDTIKVLTQEYVQSRRRVMELKVEVQKDKAKAAAARHKNSISMRQQGYPATAALIASLPLEPDRQAREYFRAQG